jgi:hypothetical protein
MTLPQGLGGGSFLPDDDVVELRLARVGGGDAQAADGFGCL